MAGYNRIVIVGNLTRDPEYKQLTSGQAVCRLGLATNRQFKNRQSGNMVQEVCYIDIDVWGAQAESCNQYLQKGRSVLIEGRLKFDSWEDQNGQSRSKHSIVADRVVFLGAGGGPLEEEDVMGSSAGSSAGSSYTNNKPMMQPARKAAEQQIEPQNEMERGLLDQINQVKGRVEKKQQQAATGEIDFKDQPPFEDDLPF